MTMYAHTAQGEAGPMRRPRGHSADRDVAAQVALLHNAIAQHSKVLAPLLVNTSSCSDQPDQVLQPGQCLLFDTDALAERLASLKSKDEKALETELKKAKKLGATRRLATPPSAAAINDLARSFPHFDAVVETVRQRAALAELTPGRVFGLPPILLAGSPGVGKTAFCEALARCLGLPTRRVDLATSTAGFVLSGSHSSWSSARPGAVWQLLQSPTASGLLLLDEIDKACSGNYPPVGPLYALLEPSSARHFMDECVELEMDASHLMAFATCNDSEQVEGALRSRFTEFVIPEPSPEQMKAVAASVYRTRRRQSAWGTVFPEELDPGAVEKLVACTPRQVAGLLEAAAAHAASQRRACIDAIDIEYASSTQQRRNPNARRVGFV